MSKGPIVARKFSLDLPQLCHSLFVDDFTGQRPNLCRLRLLLRRGGESSVGLVDTGLDLDLAGDDFR